MDVRVEGDRELVFDIDLAQLGSDAAYQQNRSSDITEPFDKVAYFLELKRPGEPLHWVYVSMDAFTDDPAKLGIPTVENGVFFQQPVGGVCCTTNTRINMAVEGANANLEFWPNSYGRGNAADVPDASDTDYDFGDAPSPDRPDGYGSMQVHLTEQKQTVFALNHWSQGNKADLGIGNNPDGNADWTFAANADIYEIKRLRIFVVRQTISGPSESNPPSD